MPKRKSCEDCGKAMAERTRGSDIWACTSCNKLYCYKHEEPQQMKDQWLGGFYCPELNCEYHHGI